MTEASTDRNRERLLADVHVRPDEFALFCDLDGTLAPIADRPERAEVSDETRRALESAASRLGFCAVVTGRPAREARRLVELAAISYAGNHGLEFLAEGTDECRPHPLLAGHEKDAVTFLDSLGTAELESRGVRVEDKGAIVALHWRGNQNSRDLEKLIDRIADQAKTAGLEPRAGRMVLELRPGIAIDKGVAVTELLERQKGINSAIFIGDDLTDLDAFAALDRLVSDGYLVSASKVAVLSGETSELGISDDADICLEGPAAVAALISEIAG